MSDSTRLLIVIGSGPGIGVGVASYFASKNFNRIALLARNRERLKEDAVSVLDTVQRSKGMNNGVTVKTYAVDASDVNRLGIVLMRVVADLGKPEVVVYNAARVGGGKFFDADEEAVDYDFRVRFIGSLVGKVVLTSVGFNTWTIHNSSTAYAYSLVSLREI
jgi:NAD(P)-dependent dehydrogenase (short-subunit alcohol dehydrogenase family)